MCEKNKTLPTYITYALRKLKGISFCKEQSGSYSSSTAICYRISGIPPDRGQT